MSIILLLTEVTARLTSALTCCAPNSAITIGTTSYCTIQDAIDAAIDGDTVMLSNGTYTGSGNVNLDYSGKLITVQSVSGNPNNCIVDCENAPDTRGVFFSNYTVCTIEGI